MPKRGYSRSSLYSTVTTTVSNTIKAKLDHIAKQRNTTRHALLAAMLLDIVTNGPPDGLKIRGGRRAAATGTDGGRLTEQILIEMRPALGERLYRTSRQFSDSIGKHIKPTVFGAMILMDYAGVPGNHVGIRDEIATRCRRDYLDGVAFDGQTTDDRRYSYKKMVRVLMRFSFAELTGIRNAAEEYDTLAKMVRKVFDECLPLYADLEDEKML